MTAKTTGREVVPRQPNGATALTLGRAGELDPFAVGKVLAASGFFPDARQEAQAVAKVIAGMEMGFGPMAAMAGVHIIEGKPSLSANLLATCVKRHPRYDYRVREHGEQGCRIEFFESGESIGESIFSLEDATRAGIASRQNFKKYPKAMMFARALSQGVRWYCPDVTAGAPAYVPEELGAEVNEEGEPVEAAATKTVDTDAVQNESIAPELEPGTELDPDRAAAIIASFGDRQMKYRDIGLALGAAGIDGLRANSAKAVEERIGGLSDEQATALEAVMAE